MKKLFLLSFLMLFVFMACKKDEEIPANPFDDPSLQPPANNGTVYNPAAGTFEYLYHNIFKPTCANSGCHDGSFEPDFRTISSSYNTLVYAPVVITPTNNPYSYRVVPGNSGASLICHRLTQLPGAGPGTLGQGRMPWNDTNWKFNSTNAQYIQDITTWINMGAKDVFGNNPVFGNKQPNTMGLEICPNGSTTALSHPKYMEISKNQGAIDIWAYVTDDSTLAQNMQSAEIKFSLNRYNFTSAITQTLAFNGSGPSFMDVTKTFPVSYNYKLSSYDLDAVLADTGYIFVRTYFKDAHHSTPSETPNNGSVYYSDYYVIKITP